MRILTCNVRYFGAEVISGSENGRFPSDHYFIAATVSIDKRDHEHR